MGSETRNSSFLKERYYQSFKIISFEGTKLLYEGRVLSVKDNIVFNTFKTLSGEPRNDYLLRSWAYPLIAPFVNGETIYEVEFSSSPLSSANKDQDYRDNVFIKNPHDLTINIYLAFSDKTSRTQIYSIIKSFKTNQIRAVNFVLYPMMYPPDLEGMQKQDIHDYHEKHSEQFGGTCVINNYENIQAEEDIVASSECMNTN